MTTENSLFALFNEIGIIAQLSGTMFERVMPEGMTLAQFTVLNHFVRLGGEKSPAQLASAFQVTRGTMTSTLQRLEGKGLIEIAPDPEDARGKTRHDHRGRAAHARALHFGNWPSSCGPIGRLNTVDVDALIELLRSIRRDLDAARDGKD